MSETRHTKVCVNGHFGLFQRRVVDDVMAVRSQCHSNVEAAQRLGISRPTMIRYAKLARELEKRRLDPDFRSREFDSFEEWHKWHEHELDLENENLAFFLPFLRALVACWTPTTKQLARLTQTGPVCP